MSMKKWAVGMLIAAGVILMTGLAVDNWRIRNGETDLLNGQEWQVRPVDASAIEVRVTAVSDADCEACQTQEILEFLQGNMFPGMEVEVVEWDSDEGGDLIEKFGAISLPFFVVEGEMESHPQWADLQGVMMERGGQWMILGEQMGLPKGKFLMTPEVGGGDFILGDADAPVTIVEFTDFECPFCSMFASEFFPDIKKDFIDTGKVRWVTKAAPLLSIHPHSEAAHRAAIAVGMQGQELFWKFHHKIFAEQERWAKDGAEGILREMASEMGGVRMENFDADVVGAEVAMKFASDMTELQDFGLSGVPAFFVGDLFQSGVRQGVKYSGLDVLIEKKLGEVE